MGQVFPYGHTFEHDLLIARSGNRLFAVEPYIAPEAVAGGLVLGKPGAQADLRKAGAKRGGRSQHRAIPPPVLLIVLCRYVYIR